MLASLKPQCNLHLPYNFATPLQEQLIDAIPVRNSTIHTMKVLLPCTTNLMRKKGCRQR